MLDDEKYSGYSRWLKEPANPGEKLMCIRVTGGGALGLGLEREPQWIIGTMSDGKNSAISRKYSSMDRGERPPTKNWVPSGFGFGGGGQEAVTLTWLESDEHGDNALVSLDAALTLEQWLERVAPGHGAELNHSCVALVSEMQ